MYSMSLMRLSSVLTSISALQDRPIGERQGADVSPKTYISRDVHGYPGWKVVSLNAEEQGVDAIDNKRAEISYATTGRSSGTRYRRASPASSQGDVYLLNAGNSPFPSSEVAVRTLNPSQHSYLFFLTCPRHSPHFSQPSRPVSASSMVLVPSHRQESHHEGMQLL